jgi:hypothetical protein
MKEALIKRSNFYHYFGRVSLPNNKNLIDITRKILKSEETIFLSLKKNFKLEVDYAGTFWVQEKHTEHCISIRICVTAKKADDARCI